MEDRPGTKALTGVDVKMAALPSGWFPLPPVCTAAAAAGGLAEPHQQPGGAFIHCVTTAVTTDDMQADTAVTVVYLGCQFFPFSMAQRRRRLFLKTYSLGHGHSLCRTRLGLDHGADSSGGGARSPLIVVGVAAAATTTPAASATATTGAALVLGAAATARIAIAARPRAAAPRARAAVTTRVVATSPCLDQHCQYT